MPYAILVCVALSALAGSWVRAQLATAAQARRISRELVNFRVCKLVCVLAALAACTPVKDRISQPPRPVVVQGISGIHESSAVATVAGSTQKICQLTREMDFSHQTPTPVANHTEQRAHLLGTDLGVSFAGPASGTIHFLFGDTVPRQQNLHSIADDAIASARVDADPERCLDLTFYTNPSHEYLPIRLKGFTLGIFDVPTSGFVANGTTYVTFATDAGGVPLRPRRSVLGFDEHFPDQLGFTYIADLSPSKLMNVSSVLVDDSWRPSRRPTQAVLFGTGLYRSSRNVFLATFPLGSIRTGAHLWFAGRRSDNEVKWSADEQQAHPVFEFRVAPKPWGPWSEPRVLFDPRADHGYCEFMHDEHPERNCSPGSPNPSDNLVSRDHGSSQYGGEYGPYVIDALTRGSAADRRTTIYFTMSTWNPYSVVLMKSTLVSASSRRPPD